MMIMMTQNEAFRRFPIAQLYQWLTGWSTASATTLDASMQADPCEAVVDQSESKKYSHIDTNLPS